MNFLYTPSTSRFKLFPCKAIVKKFYYGDDNDYLRLIENSDLDWGEATPVEVIGEKYPLPHSIELKWLSIVEKKIYKIKTDIDVKNEQEFWKSREIADGRDVFLYVVAGMAPYGGVAIWLRGYRISRLLCWLKAEEELIDAFDNTNDLIQKKCQELMAEEGLAALYLQDHNLPPSDYFDHIMEQFHYRYVPLEEYWDGENWQEYDEEDMFYDDIMINELHVQRFDGTHHELPDDISLIKYHEAGMPKRMALHWDEGRSHLSAYWWFDDQVLYPILHRFFSLNPDTRADILLRCDSRQECFEMALKSGEMLQQPITVLPEAYQLIVFKDGHELYKSENYNQEQGAWNW